MGMGGAHLNKAPALDGLGEVVVASGGEAPVAISAGGIGRYGENGDDDAGGANGAGGLVSVHDGHLHVHEDKVEGVDSGSRAHERIDGGASVAGGGDAGAGGRKPVCEEALVVGAVFGEEHTQPCEGGESGVVGAGKGAGGALGWVDRAAGDVGEMEREGAALGGRGIDLDGAAEHAREPA